MIFLYYTKRQRLHFECDNFIVKAFSIEILRYFIVIKLYLFKCVNAFVNE